MKRNAERTTQRKRKSKKEASVDHTREQDLSQSLFTFVDNGSFGSRGHQNGAVMIKCDLGP
jgi:hypothetical protein